MIIAGTEVKDNRGWRSVIMAGTNVDLRRSRLLAQVLELCGHTTGTSTTVADGCDDEASAGEVA